MIHWESKPNTLKYLGDEEWRTEATLDVCKTAQCVSPPCRKGPSFQQGWLNCKPQTSVNMPLLDSHVNREKKQFLSVKLIIL